MQGENAKSEQLMALINEDSRIFLVPSTLDDIFFLRLAICSPDTEEKDIDFSFEVIRELAGRITGTN